MSESSSTPPSASSAGQLNGAQRKYLRGLAHSLIPVVLVGASGATEGLLKSVQEQLHAHELIKIRFVASKDKQEKASLREVIARKTDSTVVGVIGHCAVLFAPHPNPNRRQIKMNSSKVEKLVNFDGFVKSSTGKARKS